MAEALAANDFEVHLFQRGDRILKPFSEATSAAVLDYLDEQQVAVYLNAEVQELAGGNRVEAVVTDDERVPVEMVLVGTGVRPRTALATNAGIEFGETGAIATDAYRETNVPDVYAAGDCSESRRVVTADPTYVPLALTANRHGRAIGRTVAGTPTAGGGVAGTATVKAFEVEAARTGVLDHEVARAAGVRPDDGGHRGELPRRLLSRGRDRPGDAHRRPPVRARARWEPRLRVRRGEPSTGAPRSWVL